MKRIRIMILLIPVLCLATVIERDTLRNGLVALTVEARRIPVIEMRAYVRAGSVYDPAGREGLANIVAEMLLRGTQNRSAQEVVESIESVGGMLSAFCDEDYIGLSGKVLNKDLALLVDLLAECLRRPSFETAEFERLKSEVVSGIRAKADDPVAISTREFRRLVFQDHRLAHLPEGHDTTVAMLTASDVREFYSRKILPDNTFLVFIGDFTRDSLLKLLGGRFGDWERKEVLAIEPERPQPVSQAVGRIVPMKISQAYITLGHVGPGYGAPDWFAARLMNYMLGSRSRSYIWDRVREEKGLAYDAYSYFKRFHWGGYFAAEVQTKKEMATEAVVTVLGAIRQVQDSLRAADVARARNFYTGYFPLTIDSYSKMADLVSQVEIEGLGLNYIDRFEDYVGQVSLEQAAAAAREYLCPDRYCLLIVGDLQPEDIAIDSIEWLE
ncbi:insulinase family protein [candidate division WOR-3 bacterium]|nr:insulinase family protein [candidate division WOR-3 bacterium]